jgi:hypothetical protein
VFSALSILPLFGISLQLEHVTAIGQIRPDGITRAGVCPDGLAFVTHSSGKLTAVGSSGAMVLDLTGVAEIEGVIGGTCDDDNRLFLSGGNGRLNIFRFAPEGQLKLERSLKIAGQQNRLLVTKSDLYVLGYSKVGGDIVPLRRFRLSDGAYLGPVPTNQPVEVEGRGNQLAINGSIMWHPKRQEMLYIPANPLMAVYFEPGTGAVKKLVPRVSNVQAADLSGVSSSGALNWSDFDWAFNSTVLPDGRIVVLVRKGRLSGQPDLALELFTADLDLIARIPVPREFGLLIGSDRDGILYFAKLDVAKGGTIAKVRLTTD